jgi:BppU N-terminal domain
MSAGEIRIGDKNTVIECTVKDQTGAVVGLVTTTSKQFIFRKPDGTAVVKNAEFTTDGSDGKIRYLTLATDLDIAGDWQLQVYVAWTTQEWRSDIQNFIVHPNLPTS